MNRILLFSVLFIVGCSTDKEPGTVPLEPVWLEGVTVDEFGNETGGAQISISIEGAFSNSTIEGQRAFLTASIQEGKLSTKLYEYSKDTPASFLAGTSIYVNIDEGDGEVNTVELLGPVGDGFYVDHYSELLEYIKEQETTKVIFEVRQPGGFSKYRFDIPGI